MPQPGIMLASPRSMKPIPTVSMTTANCGCPSTRRSSAVEPRRTAPSRRASRSRRARTAARRARSRCRRQPAQHHEIALGKVHRLGRLVDQRETERDEGEDTAHRDSADYELEKLDHGAFLAPLAFLRSQPGDIGSAVPETITLACPRRLQCPQPQQIVSRTKTVRKGLTVRSTPCGHGTRRACVGAAATSTPRAEENRKLK